MIHHWSIISCIYIYIYMHIISLIIIIYPYSYESYGCVASVMSTVITKDPLKLLCCIAYLSQTHLLLHFVFPWRYAPIIIIYNYIQLNSTLPPYLFFLKDRTEATSWGWYVGAFSTSSRALQRHPLGHGAVWEAAGGTLGLETCEVAACPRVIRSGFGAPWHKGCDVMYLNGSGGKMWRKTK